MQPSDTMWHHRSLSTMVQVMACCVTATSHYLNHCWLISGVYGSHLMVISEENCNISIHKMILKFTYLKVEPHLPRFNDIIIINGSHVTYHLKSLTMHLISPAFSSNYIDVFSLQLTMKEGRDLWWDEEMAKVNDVCEPEWMDVEEPLFMLYTR